jgi:hypothetical protein
MNKITLIGTMHKEIGNSNKESLHSIFENIGPDVIFEETTPYTAMHIYKFGIEPQFPEQKVIQKYIFQHNVENIPIDTLTHPKELDDWGKNIFEDLYNINENNKELNELLNFRTNYISKNGIESMNTEYYDNLTIKVHKLHENYINKYRKNLLIDYNKYHDFIIEQREIEMVNNILNYHESHKNNFNGIFTIGADHRITIINKLREIKDIEYEFYYKNKSNCT